MHLGEREAFILVLPDASFYLAAFRAGQFIVHGHTHPIMPFYVMHRNEMVRFNIFELAFQFCAYYSNTEPMSVSNVYCIASEN